VCKIDKIIGVFTEKLEKSAFSFTKKLEFGDFLAFEEQLC